MPAITYNEKDNKKLCAGCSLCCEYVNILIEKPKTKDAIDMMVWYLLHNVSIRVDTTGKWTVYMPFKCQALTKDKTCRIYKERPIICREHSQADCERGDDSDCGDLIFTNKKEFLKYIKSDKKLKAIYTRNSHKK